jgi:hypothetical protein
MPSCSIRSFLFTLTGLALDPDWVLLHMYRGGAIFSMGVHLHLCKIRKAVERARFSPRACLVGCHAPVKAATPCKAHVWLSIQLCHDTDFCIDSSTIFSHKCSACCSPHKVWCRHKLWRIVWLAVVENQTGQRQAAPFFIWICPSSTTTPNTTIF